MVVVLVGKERTKFNVHQDVLVKHCPFFRGCLQSGMKETLTNEVELPEKGEEAFSGFVNWVYTGEIDKVLESDDSNKAFSLWLLADKWLMHEWANKLINTMIDFHDGKSLSPRWPIFAYKETAGRTDVAVFELVKNIFLGGLKKNYLLNRNEHGRKSFETLVDKQIVSVSELMDAVNGCWGNPKKNRCDYHVHLSGEKCPDQPIKF